MNIQKRCQLVATGLLTIAPNTLVAADSLGKPSSLWNSIKDVHDSLVVGAQAGKQLMIIDAVFKIVQIIFYAIGILVLIQLYLWLADLRKK